MSAQGPTRETLTCPAAPLVSPPLDAISPACKVASASEYEYSYSDGDDVTPLDPSPPLDAMVRVGSSVAVVRVRSRNPVPLASTSLSPPREGRRGEGGRRGKGQVERGGGLAKTELCKFSPKGQCTRGQMCTYAHGGSDLAMPDMPPVRVGNPKGKG